MLCYFMAHEHSSREYRITGVLTNMGSLLKADVYGMILTEDGFRQIADENAQTGTTFRVQFKDGVNIQEAMNEIKAQYGLSDSQVSENTALLDLMGQSENSTMQSLYIVAGFLVLLVLIAGAVMIAADFNTNVLERVQFYGLLRCLGASKAQVKHFVILQGLRQSMKGVPIGLVAGQIITWCACLLLKSISGERFSEIPLFQFSVSGLIAGAVIGFLIVLLASLSPAKKASKVVTLSLTRSWIPGRCSYGPFTQNMARPCPMLKNPEWLREMVKRTDAHVTGVPFAQERGAILAQMDFVWVAQPIYRDFFSYAWYNGNGIQTIAARAWAEKGSLQYGSYHYTLWQNR